MLAVNEADGDREGMAQSLACFGVLGAVCGRAEDAARLLGAAEAQRDALGNIAALPERASYERAAATARGVLGEAAFAAAWAAGRALPLDEAIAEARRIGEAAASAPDRAENAAASASDILTPRERDVLRLLVEGRTDREIAAALFISHRTVMRHVSGILAKLGADNRTAASNLAVRRGLV